jgi:hypothetical protein
MALAKETTLDSIVGLLPLLRWRLTLADFTAGAPGTRAWGAVLALLSAWLCSDVQAKQAKQQLENADKEACMILLHEVMPMLRSTAARVEEAVAGAEPNGSSPDTIVEACTQQQASQQGPSSEQAEGSTQPGVQPVQGTAAGQAAGQQPISVAAPALPPLDSMLLLMMAAARALKVAVQLSCQGQHCTCCGMWEAYGRKTIGSRNKVVALTQSGIEVRLNHGQSLEPGVQEVEDVEAALGDLLSLASSLCHEPLYQEAVSHHPLLYLQALLSTMNVSWCRAALNCSSAGQHCINFSRKPGLQTPSNILCDLPDASPSLLRSLCLCAGFVRHPALPV